MEGDIKNIYKRLDNMDKRFDNMDIRFNNLEKKVDLIGSQLTESLSIVNRKADSLYVDDINNRTKNLEKVVFA
jgi:tetrahydromethanopterin S-methyltransferase subunit G